MGFNKDSLPGIRTLDGADLFRQTYENILLPHDVAIIKTPVFYDDWGGYFRETVRIGDDGSVISLKEKGIDFRIKQINGSQIGPKGERFWHIHPSQNEIWSAFSTILVGLVDLRTGSETYGLKSKVVLSIDRILHIPAGVAHGFINPNNETVGLTYMPDAHFQTTDGQEYRIDPSQMPYDFVKPDIM